LAAVPSIGRAARVERPAAPGSDATRDLYERFSGQIFGYCLHQLGSREEAEDAVQTTFMNAFRGLQRGIVPQVESAWLFKIAHNVCLSRRRSTWRRGKVEAPNNLEVLQEVIPGRERLGDELIRLPEVLEEMPETQRRAILLREWQGLSYREIAEELDLSQSAVETLIFRARRALAAGLEVEPERPSWRKRARHGVDAGGVLTALKALLTGGTAMKVAATVAVATTAAVAVSGGQHHAVRHTRTPSPRATHAQTGSVAPTHALTAVSAHHAAVTPRHERKVSAVHKLATPKPRAAAAPAPAVAHDEPAPAAAAAPPVASPPPAAQGNGRADDSKPARTPKHEHPPAIAPGHASPAPAAAHGNGHGKGHDKQPPVQVQDPQVAPQPAPPAVDDQPQGQGQQGEKSGNGNGNGGGNGDGNGGGNGNHGGNGHH